MKTVTAGRSRRDRRDGEDFDLVSGSTYERACPQCGRLFLCFSVTDWVYRRGEYKVFCSWTCYRADQRGEPPKAQAAQARPVSPKRNNTRFDAEAAREQTKEIIRMKAEGRTAEECAVALGLTVFQVNSRLQKFGRELGWVPFTKSQAGIAGVEARKNRRRQTKKARAGEA